jgi:hypothetical protein
MFRWVQIWLNIFLPARDDLNIIRRRDTTTKILEQLRDNIIHEYDAYQLLDLGYQRLWAFNDLHSYQNQRIHFFQIVLAAFRPFSPEELTEALRIQGNRYDHELTTEIVKRLYSNFLYENHQSSSSPLDGPLRFIHESTRKFILNIGMQ